MKNVGLVVLGIGGFVVASVIANVAGVVVRGFFPDSNRPDPPGYLEPAPEDKAKKEWEAKNGKTETNPKPAQQPKAEEPKEAKQNTETTEEKPAQQAEVQPEPQRSSPPTTVARPTTGPGNFDQPVYDPPPVYMPTGPGNL